jgi:hypothetical protein
VIFGPMGGGIGKFFGSFKRWGLVGAPWIIVDML